MEKLYKRMDAAGIEYDRRDFGGNYFKNAPELHFPGALVTLNRGDINRAAWKDLKAYCRRYGYDLRPWGGFPGVTWFIVCRAEDRAALDLYSEYQKLSVSACEQHIHIRKTGAGFTGLTDREFNEFLSGVMDYYGAAYNLAAAEREEKTA